MLIPKRYLVVLGLIIGISATLPVTAKGEIETQIAKGKYLVEIAGCNDCHTSGYAPSGGKIPESQWLLGDSLGYRGPWGTTYPINLREYIGEISENEWVKEAKVLKAMPPMPSWALNAMSENDLRALYAYIKSLGSVKNEVPSFLDPDVVPKTPYIQWPMPPK